MANKVKIRNKTTGKIEEKWACTYCGKIFADSSKADACRDGHELIYVPLSKTDLNRLINFIYTKNEELLTPTLVKTLTRYLRGN